MTSLTKAELEKLVGLSLASMQYLIKTCGHTIETHNLMGKLTKEEIYSFQLIDKILQLPTARAFISGKSFDNKDITDKLEMEGNEMTTCRALVPVKSNNAMDIKVLEAINKINKCGVMIEKTAQQRAMASIKATTNNICIEGALSILNAFGYYNDTFHLESEKWQACDLQEEVYFPDLQGRMACETPIIWFWGGPPTKLKWYKGTLQTLLNDRVLYEINHRGVSEVASIIGTDLEGMADVSAHATSH